MARRLTYRRAATVVAVALMLACAALLVACGGSSGGSGGTGGSGIPGGSGDPNNGESTTSGPAYSVPGSVALVAFNEGAAQTGNECAIDTSRWPRASWALPRETMRA